MFFVSSFNPGSSWGGLIDDAADLFAIEFVEGELGSG